MGDNRFLWSRHQFDHLSKAPHFLVLFLFSILKLPLLIKILIYRVQKEPNHSFWTRIKIYLLPQEDSCLLLNLLKQHELPGFFHPLLGFLKQQDHQRTLSTSISNKQISWHYWQKKSPKIPTFHNSITWDFILHHSLNYGLKLMSGESTSNTSWTWRSLHTSIIMHGLDP